MPFSNRNALAGRLVDSLYTEAMLLTDETRGYFDGTGRIEQAMLAPRERVEFACEGLKATARLMQLTGWLLARKAAGPGAPGARLGSAPALDAAVLAHLPESARRLLTQGRDLYERVARLEAGGDEPTPSTSPARSLLQRLERSL